MSLPFAADEISSFCNDVEAELQAKVAGLTVDTERRVDLSLDAIRLMKDFLRRRQLEESGVTGVSIWAESHAAIHTWDEDNYYAFGAFSCRDFRPQDALRLLVTYFDVEILNCVNLFRYQRSAPRVSSFQVNAGWDVLVDGRVVGTSIHSTSTRCVARASARCTRQSPPQGPTTGRRAPPARVELPHLVVVALPRTGAAAAPADGALTLSTTPAGHARLSHPT